MVFQENDFELSRTLFGSGADDLMQDHRMDDDFEDSDEDFEDEDDEEFEDDDDFEDEDDEDFEEEDDDSEV